MDEIGPNETAATTSDVNRTWICPEGQTYMWLVFMGSTVAFPVVLAALLGLWRSVRGIWHICRDSGYVTVPGRRRKYRNKEVDEADWEAIVKRFCKKLVSGTLMSGKLLVLLEFLAGMIALSVYFHQVSRRSRSIHFCESWFDRPDWQIELACNLFLLLVFAVRFIAANEKFWFMAELISVVDYCTIPPAITSLIWHRGWIGLRCLRACHLLAVPEILQFFNILKTRAAIRLAQLTCQLLAVLLVASGLFHLLESTTMSHDFSGQTEENLSYWEFVYFSVVTLSTVGYGDISPKTLWGRLLCCIFIVSALALFASAIPEVFVILSTRRKHGGSYKVEPGQGHIIITGHVTLNSMTKILNEFYYKDIQQDDLKLVFVDFAEPDLEMESYLKRNSNWITFLQGSLVRVEDMRRARVQDALACMVVTNKNSATPDKDDSTSVMIVTSLKNYSPNTRCIIQLLQTNAKNLLMNIPAFSVKRGDAVICFQELELALIAQNCLSRGCGTLLLNLCAPAFDPSVLENAKPHVQDYAKGCLMNVHLQSFSSFFVGMTFCSAAAFCKDNLDLLLIGLFKPTLDNSRPGLVLCPTEMNITADRVGIFVSPSDKDAARARDYCPHCHKDVTDFHLITSCECTDADFLRRKLSKAAQRNPFERLLSMTDATDMATTQHRVVLKRPPGWEKKLLTHVQDNPTPRDITIREGAPIPMSPIMIPVSRLDSQTKRKRLSLELVKLDLSGNFYWSAARTFQSVEMTRSAAALRTFKDHVVVLIMAHPEDPPIGLRELVVPLRTSRIPYDELKEVVFLGNAAFLEREWPDLYNLPKITMVKGNPLNRADLRAVSIRHCSMCVVLSAWTGTAVDPILDDKAAILAALNVKAMPFEDERDDIGAQFQGKPSTIPEGVEHTIPSNVIDDGPQFEVPLTVELQHKINVRLLDDSDHSEATGLENLSLMEPFLTGQAVVFGALDSLLVTSFRNPLAIPIMQQLLYGFKSPILENLLAEGIGFVGGEDYRPEHVSPFGTRIRLIPLHDGPWTLPESKKTDLKYVDVFDAAAQIGVICLGISRKFGALKEFARIPKRCVLTNPARDYPMRSDDLIYVLSR